MNINLSGLDKAFENRVRLGIMSILMVNDKMDFNTLKDMLKITDGNLASHTNALEKIDYIKIEKGFVGKKTRTEYMATTNGKTAFNKHIDALEKLIKRSI